MAGNFFSSAQNVRLEQDHILRASLQRSNGEWVDAEVDLNTFIGNIDGRFTWGDSGFSNSAEDCSCSVEGADSVCILRAKLRRENGDLVESDLNLSERLDNSDGQFVFV